MTLRTMQCKAVVKADDSTAGLADGQFEAIVSVFDEVDSYGDVVVKGAFAETLGEWKSSGDSIPVIWSHDWSDPFAHVGTVKSAEETDRGLLIRGEIPAEDRETNPKAAQVYHLLKNRRVTQFSFAFDVLDGGEVEVDGEYRYELRRLKLHEVGPCLLGVNQATELIAAKSATADHGKVVTLGRVKAAVAKANTLDELVAARDALNSAIEELSQDEPDSDDETTEGDTPEGEQEEPTEGEPGSAEGDSGAPGADSGAKSARARDADLLRQIDFGIAEIDLT